MKNIPKTSIWKKSKLVGSLTKAGWYFFFKEDAPYPCLWGSYLDYKIRLYDNHWTLYEDLPTGLAEIISNPYSRRQAQEIKRAVIRVSNRRLRESNK
jgi:hypothetical protein